MKIWTRTGIALLGAACVLGALTGCQPAPEESGGRLSVAASFYPFQYVAERVGGDAVTVTNLTAPGAEPHDLELAPQQLALLASADLVVFQTGFQPAVDQAMTQVTPKRVVDTASFLTLVPAADDGADDHADQHADEHGALDPHVWLDPTQLVTVAEHVRDALTQAHPESAASFAAHAASLIDDLTALDQEFTTGLANCRLRVFVTSHTAFGYLARRYDLEQVGIRGLEPDTEPTAARIAEVQQLAKDKGVTTIFFETLASPVVAQSIARDLGLKTDVLDPLEGLTADSRGTDYREVMRANLASLRAANQCS